MNKVRSTISIVLFASTIAWAQHGTAPGGYYPMGYQGDTWTGTVTAVNDSTREITLSYTKGDKTETFTGILQAGFSLKTKDGSMHEVKPSEIPLGTRLVVYYKPDAKKVAEKKVNFYEIFKLTTAPEPKKK
jgi:3D (Asp-Asp-Asp) domain-containing protein